MNPTSTIHVVDDDLAVRDALAMMLEQQGMAVATYASGSAFLDAVRPEDRGCAILDLHMPGLNGLAVQEEMHRRGLLLAVLLLSGRGDIPASVKAIKAGAVNFLTKPVTMAALLENVRAAVAESEQAHQQALAGRSAHALLASLTEREREVMGLALEGMPNKEIARALGISHRTVEIHKARLMHKMGVDNLLDLARVAEAGGAGT
jgi:RNA polymerase sigma factor (sigma-70 family)